MTPEELSAWYRDEYFRGPYEHTRQHDVGVAALRMAAYARDGVLHHTDKVLDVGSGNGAFVSVLRGAGFDAWGQDLSADAEDPHVYVGALEDIGFPADAFDVVTVHDVLEHVVDPRRWLQETARVCRPGGTLILDFPRFWHESGRHHWKAVQHLWMFTEQELLRLLAESGFVVRQLLHPIASKIVIYATRKTETRLQILTPAGIGDTYWSLVKLPGLLRSLQRTGEMTDVWVQDSGGPKRTEPFVRTLPDFHAAGYKTLSDRDPLFHEAYIRDARTVFKDVCGVDYFVAYNGVMRAGKSLVDVDAGYGVDWYPRMFVSKEARDMQARLEAAGPYCVVYIVGHGMYKHWLAEFTGAQIKQTLALIQHQLGLRIVIVGAPWDAGSAGDALAQDEASWINLTAQTSYDQLLGVLRGASLVFGFPSGLTILGPVLKRPTVMLWHQYFQEQFWTNACPPSGTYTPMQTYRTRPDRIVDAARALMR